jgi:hypothetical protein
MTTHKEIVKALNDLGAKEWTLSGDEIADIIWLTNDKKTEAEIEAAIANPLPNKAEADKAALLAKLGITADEAKLLLS